MVFILIHMHIIADLLKVYAWGYIIKNKSEPIKILQTNPKDVSGSNFDQIDSYSDIILY